MSAAEMLPGLQREVRDHEPLVALVAWAGRSERYPSLARRRAAFLRENGHLLMEIGFDQGETVQELIDKNVWTLERNSSRFAGHSAPRRSPKDLNFLPQPPTLRCLPIQNRETT